MKLVLLAIITCFVVVESSIVVDFSKVTDLVGWRVVDDVVMGGRSSGSFRVDKAGEGVFEGKVSLENNGGFSSVRYRHESKRIGDSKFIHLHLKGDGKKYQFRMKHSSGSYYSYVYTFDTSGEWEHVFIPIEEMYPSFRGRKLNLPNFNHSSFEELAFLISNKKAEKFKLRIKTIGLE